MSLGALDASAADDPTYNVVDRPSTGVTADALPTVQIDGVVWATAIAGDTVFAGGQFANARPAGAAAGTNQTPRANLLSFNLRTGVLNTGFNPTVNGRIRAMTLSPDKKTLYIAGAFTQVNGVNRYRVAAFDTATGALRPWAPAAGGDVFAITASDSTVYLGGWFTSVGGQPRSRLAAVTPSTSGSTGGTLLSWAPVADSTVNTMTMTPDKTRVIIGGIFANVNGVQSLGLSSLDAATGTRYYMGANDVIQNYGNSAGIQNLRSDGTNVYATAYWFGGTGNFEGMAVLDPISGAVKSMADCHGDTYDSAVVGSTVYTVSHQHYCENIGGFPDTNPRTRFQYANAYTVDATTTVKHDKQGYHDFFGQPSPSIVAWFPTMVVGTYSGQGQAGWTLSSTSEYLVQGGEFPSVNGTAQQGLVRFAIPSIAPNKQAPIINAANSVPTLRGVSGTTVRVAFPANFDRDDQLLTYKVSRGVNGASNGNYVYTTTARSQFWNRPTQVFLDTGLTPNTTYTYNVLVSDANGNLSRSANATITTGTNVVDQSAYSQAVTTDGAKHYWRLDENPGETTSVDWAGGNDLVLGSGVANGQPGAVINSADTAASFDGTGNGTAGTTSTEPGSTNFSAELWFKTTTTSGGKLLGFGDSQLGTSGNYDRHIYMGGDGRLTFGVYPGGVQTLRSSAALNDGQWHHVVASLSPAGTQFYVDGVLEGANASVTSAQDYAGYWRVGGDNLGGWPDAPGNAFVGTIDDVAIYPAALTGAQVRDHYTKSGRTLDFGTEPADAYGKKVFNDNPSLYWRLNDTGAPVKDTSANNVRGNLSGDGTTFSAASDVAPGSSVSFNGTNATIASSRMYANPTTYSEELWFNTTTTNGGKLIGFGNSPSGNSSGYDRHVWMTNNGQLVFGTYTGQLNTAQSSASYNDGSWHHMVATQDGSGMKLYVDNVLVATNGQTQAQPYDGYWRIGGDVTWFDANSYYFNGKIDEVAVYPYALSSTQVNDHYRASSAAVNTAPVASFVNSCTDGTCTFDGSASSDADGTVASYAWTFGDGGTSTAVAPVHTYTTSGTYSVTLTVTDDKGKTNAKTADVTVTVPAPNQPPVAAFTSACTLTVCSFTDTSTDADGTIASRSWDFGDGGTSTLANPQHTYATAGTYAVKLTVTDNRGGVTTVTQQVRVNAAPTAAYTSSCANLVCSFDGSTSADTDGTIASYAWDFGDGGTATVAKPDHTFATAGTYTVKLTVTDNDGATDVTTKSVTVQAANVTPTAAFTQTVANLKVTFDATSSTDSDGTIASYAWNFGDGTTGTGANPVHTYATGDTFTVTLTVTDNRGGTGTTTASVTTTVPPNQAPTAAFTTTKSDLKVNFDGTGSTDPDGTIASYAWDFGDNTAAGSGATPVHTYASAGTYSVKLTVTDNRGGTDTKTVSITVTAAPVNQKPTASFTATPNDLSVAVNGSGSSDPDGTIASYAWNFGDGTTGTGATTSRTYTAAGTYTVTLTVTDNQGLTDTATKSVTVTAPATTVIAKDTFSRTQARWGTATTGGAWTDTLASAFSTNGSKGQILLSKAGSGPIATLNGVSALNTRTTVDVSVDKIANGAGTYVILSSRKSGTNELRLKARFMADGTVRLVTTTVVGGTETTLKESVVTGLTYQANDVFTMSFEVTGGTNATLTGKIWKATATEPAAAQISSTSNAVQAAGSPAIQGYLSGSATNAPVNVTVDNYEVSRLN